MLGKLLAILEMILSFMAIRFRRRELVFAPMARFYKPLSNSLRQKLEAVTCSHLKPGM
jgi:L-lysine 2,3-aminomutase